MLLKEIVYMCLDELKLHSDDTEFTEAHIAFLANKWRAFLLKKQYLDIKKEIPQSNYQTVCLSLEVDNSSTNCESTISLRSAEELPDVLPIGSGKVFPSGDYFTGEITYVSKDRLKYVGNNKYLKNIIYCALGPDKHLYFKSNNPQFAYLKKVKYSGIFEDTLEASNYECADSEGNTTCSYLDKEFPLEPALVPLLVQSIVQELSSAVYKPSDDTNNAKDDLASLAYFIRRNLKSDLTKELEK